MVKQVNYEKMTKAELIEVLKSRESTSMLEHTSNEQSPLADLRTHQAELEMQNEEHRETHQELESSRNRHTDIYDSVPVGYVSLDSKAVIKEINLTCATLLGRERSLLLDKPFSIFINPEDTEAFLAYLKECKRVKGQVTTELKLKTTINKSIHVLLQSIAVQVSEDSRIGFRVVIIDITGRKSVEQKLQDANKTLERQVSEQTTKLEEALMEVGKLNERLEAANIYLHQEIKSQYNFEEIVGESEALKKVLESVEQVASTEATVLILGETGTGKELIAHAIHKASWRSSTPIVRVDCNTLQKDLIESELFGHEKGAFTGAVVRQIGRIEFADGGTLFLDEIGDLPLNLQGKLLRVLQTGEFESIGDFRTKKADIRIIAATNVDLKKAVRFGKFREDLYFRLNVFPITIPPLRERQEDIPLLANYLTQKYVAKYNKFHIPIPQKIMDSFLNYSWPGNVRELEKVIERAVIIGGFFSVFPGDDDSLMPHYGKNWSGSDSPKLQDIERQHILNVLEECKWVIEGKHGAAVRLDIKASTLRSRMKKLGIKRPS